MSSNNDICKKYQNLPTIILKKGSVLYTGSKVESAHTVYHSALINPLRTTKENVFKYQGISSSSKGYVKLDNHDLYVSFFSPNINTAIGYAGNISMGWINKYEVVKDVKVYDYDDYLIVEEIAECICKSKINKNDVRGIGVTEYGYENSEYAICNPWKVMKYVGSAVLNKKSEVDKFNNVYIYSS